MIEQSTESNNSSDSHISNLYVAIIFGLGLLSLWLLAQPSEIRLALLVTIPLCFFFLYLNQSNIRRNQIKEWLVENVLTVTAVITTWLLLNALMLWLVVTFGWI
jgi:hypothetical protein